MVEHLADTVFFIFLFFFTGHETVFYNYNLCQNNYLAVFPRTFAPNSADNCVACSIIFKPDSLNQHLSVTRLV